MKTVNCDKIIDDYGCPEIPYNEMVTMTYSAIIEAMREACNQAIELAAENAKAIEELHPTRVNYFTVDKQSILNTKSQII